MRASSEDVPRTVAHFVTVLEHAAAKFKKKKKSDLPSLQGFTFLLDVFMTSYVFVSRCNLALDCLNILSRISEIHLEKLTSGF